MAPETDKEDIEERLKRKTASGALNILKALFDNPEFGRAIRKAFIKHSVVMALFLSFMVVGLFMILDAVKSIYNIGVAGNLVIGVTLISVGATYIIRSLR